jgi:hypothetical protein
MQYFGRERENSKKGNLFCLSLVITQRKGKKNEDSTHKGNERTILM